MTKGDLDVRMAVVEEKVDAISKDVSEVKDAMKEHRGESLSNMSRLHTKVDGLIWAIVLLLIGITGVLIKAVLF